jgi:hypothetical protein
MNDDTEIQVGPRNPQALMLFKALLAREKRLKDEENHTIRKKVADAVKQINPSLSGLKEFMSSEKWTFDGKPIVPYPLQDSWEGEADADGLPKNAKLSQQLLEEAKSKCYEMWKTMLDDGLFDPGNSETEAKVEKDAEEIDMAEIARRQKEKEQEKTVDEVVSDKTPDDEWVDSEKIPSPSPIPSGSGDSLMDIKDLSVSDQVDKLLDYNKSVGTPPAMKMLNTLKAMQENKPHPVIAMREAIEELARGVVGPASDSDLQDRIDRIEAKLDELIDFRRETESNMKKNLSEVVGDIVREKMKGMFS